MAEKLTPIAIAAMSISPQQNSMENSVRRLVFCVFAFASSAFLSLLTSAGFSTAPCPGSSAFANMGFAVAVTTSAGLSSTAQSSTARTVNAALGFGVHSTFLSILPAWTFTTSASDSSVPALSASGGRGGRVVDKSIPYSMSRKSRRMAKYLCV